MSGVSLGIRAGDSQLAVAGGVQAGSGGDSFAYGIRAAHQGNLIVVDPVILESARKHGIDDGDILHAWRNPIRVFDLDGLTMLIGSDQSGRILEIGVAEADRIEFVVHAMSARAKFLET